MSLFVEASGYSQTDVDNAYAQGVSDGSGDTLKGNATPSQVLQGYTFSSASAGVNKTGTIPVRNNVQHTVAPNSAVGFAAGYYNNLQVSGQANTETFILNANSADMGAGNVNRYVDATAYVTAQKAESYNSGHSVGVVDGKYAFVNECVGTHKGFFEYKTVNNDGTQYSAFGNGYNRQQSFVKDCILIFTYASSRTTPESAWDRPQLKLTVTSVSGKAPALITSRNLSDWASGHNYICDDTWIYRVYAGSTISAVITNVGEKSGRALGCVEMLAV